MCDRDHAEYLQMVNPAHHVLDVTAGFMAKRWAQPQADMFIDQVPHFVISNALLPAC